LSRYLGSIVHCLAVHDDKYILAGTEKGDILLLDSRGRIAKIKPVDKSTIAVLDTYANLDLIDWDI
jgi:hypothetical protein